jgi:CRISPR/Cas system-associated exonuclease Cas4 (RecB family)
MDAPAELRAWEVNDSIGWPPAGDVKPPISPTLYERLKKCSLRARFINSGRSYEPRLSPYARIGIAFHNAAEQAMANRGTGFASVGDFKKWAFEYFRDELAKQKEESSRSWREDHTKWDSDWVQIAVKRNEQAIVKHAVAIWNGRRLSEQVYLRSTGDQQTHTELWLTSADKLLAGRADLVLEEPTGTVIVDYKTGRADKPEKAEQYRRQLHLYAYMWFDSYGKGDWPVKGVIDYISSGDRYEESIDPRYALEIAEDAKAMAGSLPDTRTADEQAAVGQACEECDFKPWCIPYRRMLDRVEILESENDNVVSIAGTVKYLERGCDVAGSQTITLSIKTSKNRVIEATGTTLQHPGLLLCGVGDRVLILNGTLYTEDDLRVRLGQSAEVFHIITDDAQVKPLHD